MTEDATHDDIIGGGRPSRLCGIGDRPKREPEPSATERELERRQIDIRLRAREIAPHSQLFDWLKLQASPMGTVGRVSRDGQVMARDAIAPAVELGARAILVENRRCQSIGRVGR